MINFLNLEYFVVAAEELNFTKAAKRLFISQQSLSNHIAHIEKEFGVALFNRTTPLTLTYAGQRLLVRARTLLTYKDETYHELADIKDFTVGQLSIGLSHTRGRVILPHVLPAYRSRFPNIDLNILEGNTSQLETALLHGDVDLVIGMLPFRVENIETVLALSARGMGVTFYPEMFAANRETLSPAANGGSPLHLYSLKNPVTHGTLAIGYHKGHYMSQATKEFIRIVKEMIC